MVDIGSQYHAKLEELALLPGIEAKAGSISLRDALDRFIDTHMKTIERAASCYSCLKLIGFDPLEIAQQMQQGDAVAIFYFHPDCYRELVINGGKQNE